MLRKPCKIHENLQAGMIDKHHRNFVNIAAGTLTSIIVRSIFEVVDTKTIVVIWDHNVGSY